MAKFDEIADHFGPSVRHLTLSYDGVTSYTTTFTGVKDTFRKFCNISSLTLEVASGANSKQVFDYLDQYP